jgi:uncharacterized membrane protein YgaE (UPF0421/DUF939 family)
MGKQILLNTLYNIGIFISLMTAYWGITNSRYEYVAAGVVVAAVFVFLKIKIIKQVRSNIKK